MNDYKNKQKSNKYYLYKVKTKQINKYNYIITLHRIRLRSVNVKEINYFRLFSIICD
jgi:hypothetical protein